MVDTAKHTGGCKINNVYLLIERDNSRRYTNNENSFLKESRIWKCVCEVWKIYFNKQE